jgi:hypothetical protein
MKGERELIERATDNGGLLLNPDRRSPAIEPRRWQRAQDRGLWLQVAPGAYRHAATPLTLDMQIRAGAAWLGKRGALWGATALTWLGVEVAPPATAAFLVPRSLRSIPNWAAIHTTTQWNDRDVILHRGVRTTTATRAILDFATSGASATELAAVIDSAIRHRRTSLPTLRRRLVDLSGRGRSGSRRLQELLLDSGGESYLERRFLRLLRAAGLPRPECQVVFKSKGRHVARVDFRFRDADVVVEVSGRLGHTSDRDRQRDARRRNALQQDHGQDVIEFTTCDVIDDPDYVLRSLRTSLHLEPPP